MLPRYCVFVGNLLKTCFSDKIKKITKNDDINATWGKHFPKNKFCGVATFIKYKSENKKLAETVLS